MKDRMHIYDDSNTFFTIIIYMYIRNALDRYKNGVVVTNTYDKNKFTVPQFNKFEFLYTHLSV